MNKLLVDELPLILSLMSTMAMRIEMTIDENHILVRFGEIPADEMRILIVKKVPFPMSQLARVNVLNLIFVLIP